MYFTPSLAIINHMTQPLNYLLGHIMKTSQANHDFDNNSTSGRYGAHELSSIPGGHQLVINFVDGTNHTSHSRVKSPLNYAAEVICRVNKEVESFSIIDG